MNKNYRILRIFIYYLCQVSFLWGAWSTAYGQEVVIQKNLQAWKPLIGEITHIQKSPIEGIYSVETNQPNVYYTDTKGQYHLRGVIFDVASKRNLTEDRKEQMLKVNWETFPLEQAIKIVRDSGKRKLVVFADPRCPYCKQLEQELQQIGDLTTYVFVIPVLGAESHKLTPKIVCAKDPSKYWLDLMLGKTISSDNAQVPTCDSEAIIKRNLRLADELNIKGVPVIFFPNGVRFKGLMKAFEIDKTLDQIKIEVAGRIK